MAARKALIHGEQLGSAVALEALEEFAERLEGLDVEQAMPALVDAIREEQLATIAAGADAYGRPWAPRQDGGAPLRGAAAAVSVTSHGLAILVELTGIEVAHHLGFARGYKGGSKLRRPIIPEKPQGLPPRWVAALKRTVAEELGFVSGPGGGR